MKKLFTLLFGVLMAGSAFGQANWKNVVVNGDFEAEAPAYENYDGMPADAWNSFWVHEWPGDMSAQYQGTVTIVDGVGVDGSRCAKVVARSDEQAIAAGNRVEANGNLASWDCQFFIYATEPMPEGKEVRLIMYVKADKEGSMETQAHFGPGNYNHYQLFGNVSVTTEWKKVTLEATVSADHVKESDGKAFQSVAFNLSTNAEGNVFYFDDIKLQMKDPKTDEGGGNWINFMRKGIYSMDHIVGVGIVSENGVNVERRFECTNFTFQDLNQPEGQQQQPAPVVEVPGEPGVMAVHIPVPGYTIKEVEDLDDEGNQQFDEDGNVMMKSVYYWNDGREIGTSAPARWTCQFFVSTLHKMVPGEKYRFKFRCKADKPTSLGTQCHYGPGQYQSYNTFGSESNFAIGTDWIEFKLGDYEENTSKTIPSGVSKPKDSADFPGEKVGCQTITFDCVPLEGDDNNFYLIVDEFSFTETNVIPSDITLGTPEELALPVNSGEEEAVVTLDMANMLNTFELEDFSFLKNPGNGDGMKLYLVKEPDDPEDDPIESFSGILVWTDGGFINGTGQYIDDDQGINLYFDEESIDGTKVNLNIWRNPDCGISFEGDNTVKTKLAIANAGWYYVYNITLMNPEKYAEVLGIAGVKQVKANNGLIYNLAGQRVDASYKGLVIKNGQKTIQK